MNHTQSSPWPLAINMSNTNIYRFRCLSPKLSMGGAIVFPSIIVHRNLKQIRENIVLKAELLSFIYIYFYPLFFPFLYLPFGRPSPLETPSLQDWRIMLNIRDSKSEACHFRLFRWSVTPSCLWREKGEAPRITATKINCSFCLAVFRDVNESSKRKRTWLQCVLWAGSQVCDCCVQGV